MTSSHDSVSPLALSPLQQLPAELLLLIVEHMDHRSVLAYGLACRYFHETAKTKLAYLFRVAGLLQARGGEPNLEFPKLLMLILEDFRRAKVVYRYVESAAGGVRRNRHNQQEPWDDHGGLMVVVYPRSLNGEHGLVEKLQALLQTSPAVPELMRAVLLRALAISTRHVDLQGLLLLLCPHLEELHIGPGIILSHMMAMWPIGLAESLTHLKKVSSRGARARGVDASFVDVIMLLKFGGLETLILDNVCEERHGRDLLMRPRRIYCPLRTMSLTDSILEPGQLVQVLSRIGKPEYGGAYEGLRHLQFIYCLKNTSVVNIPASFHPHKLIPAIRDQVGASLERLEIGCSTASWYLACERLNFYCDWSFNHEINLRNGFPGLKEVIISADLMVCGWPDEYASSVGGEVESLPLSIMLPQALQVLRIPRLVASTKPTKDPNLLQKLINHVENDLATTPDLCELHLDWRMHDTDRDTDEKLVEARRMLDRASHDLKPDMTRLRDACVLKDIVVVQHIRRH